MTDKDPAIVRLEAEATEAARKVADESWIGGSATNKGQQATYACGYVAGYKVALSALEAAERRAGDIAEALAAVDAADADCPIRHPNPRKWPRNYEDYICPKCRADHGQNCGFEVQALTNLADVCRAAQLARRTGGGE